jgi:hypothetical protein
LAYFDIPLNLPHAGVVAARISALLSEEPNARRRTREAASALSARLLLVRTSGEDPPEAEAEPLRQEALALARELSNLIESNDIGSDRLGQRIRNLFECLAEGREGAEAGLRCGENPDSLQRPV